MVSRCERFNRLPKHNEARQEVDCGVLGEWSDETLWVSPLCLYCSVSLPMPFARFVVS